MLDTLNYEVKLGIGIGIIIIIIIIIILLCCRGWYNNLNINYNILNKTNLVIISMVLVDHDTSIKRIENLKKHINKYDLPMIIINKNKDVIKSFDSKNKNSTQNILSFIDVFKKSKYEYAIITEDDFEPIPNMLEELNKTVKLLPPNWRTLHLCPRYLWGKNFRDKNKIGKLNPEGDISDLNYHISKRYIIPDNYLFNKKNIWLGGPTCLLVNKSTINNLLNDFNKQDNKLPCDVIFTKILNKNDYVAMTPQLGFENEQGQSIYDEFLVN
jgi:hypothetical protein